MAERQDVHDDGEADEELAVSTVELDTDDGDTVVLHQQNVGPTNQVGAGEFKEADRVSSHKRPEDAAREERELEEERPI